MYRNLLILIVVIFSSVSVSADTGCVFYEHQYNFLNKNEKSLLKIYGVIATPRMEYGKYPSIVVSDKVISDCGRRVVSEKYIENHIQDKNLFQVSRKEILISKKDIANVLFILISHPDAWFSGMPDEVYFSITQDIRAEWTPYLISYTNNILQGSNSRLDHRAFPAIELESPSNQLIVAVNQWLQSKNINQIDAAFLWFIKKNHGDFIPDNIKSLLSQKLKVDIKPLTIKIDVINDAYLLLVKQKKISKSEIFDYLINAYSDESY